MAAPKHFLDLDQVDPKTLRQILDHGKAMKKARANGGHDKPLAGKTLAMIFEKPSTRTRVSFELAALGTDAGMTSYHGIVTKGGLQAGMKVGVIGLGGLGQIGARVGVVLGAEVHVCEKNEAVWPMAEEIGAFALPEVVAAISDKMERRHPHIFGEATERGWKHAPNSKGPFHGAMGGRGEPAHQFFIIGRSR